MLAPIQGILNPNAYAVYYTTPNSKNVIAYLNDLRMGSTLSVSISENIAFSKNN